MAFEVRLSPDALADLEAAHVEERILAAADALARHPRRGPHPKELLELGIRAYRETFFKPYRIVYAVEGRHVDVFLIADGRRDMQALLARRLLGA
jgi:toxin ParE1/3/4